jgi:hypothetical protein
MFIVIEGFETDATLSEVFEIGCDKLLCSVEGDVIFSDCSSPLIRVACWALFQRSIDVSSGEASFHKPFEDSSHRQYVV